MTVLSTLAAIAVSTSAIGYLTATDAKRRRVFGQEPINREPWQKWAALGTLFLPGVLLLAVGNGAGFTVWIAAATVLGWVLAAMTPDRAARLHDRFRESAGAARRGITTTAMTLGALVRMPRKIADLEARIAELEAELEQERSHKALPAPARSPKPRRGAAERKQPAQAAQ